MSYHGYGSGGGMSGIGGRLLIAAAVAAFSVFSYCGSRQFNAVTGKTVAVGAMTPDREIALGMQAAPQMAAQYGGKAGDVAQRDRVARIGQRLVERGVPAGTPWKFEFHLLRDPETVNAFALPGGQMFMTEGLRRRLKTDGQIAGVLGHEIGHVLARHGAQHMAKQQLTAGLTGAAVMATYDPNNPASRGNAAVAAMVGQLVNMKYGREDELESDRLGVKIMTDAGYDPRGLLEVMQVLKASGGGGRQPEFFASHPNPDNRLQRIQEAIQQAFPNGLPPDLEK